MAALLVRLIYVLFFAGAYLYPDSQDWIATALRLVQLHTYGDCWRPPLYPFFLAGIYFFCGESLLAVRIFQSVLGALTCLLLYFTGRTVFNRKVGFICSILALLYPYFIYYTGDILAETILTFLLSASIASIAWFQREPDFRRAGLTGLCLGLTALCKPVILPFVVVVLCWMIFRLRHQCLRALQTSLLTGTVTLLVILPWTIRNYIYYHEFILVSTGGLALWMSYNPYTERLEQVPELLSTADQNSHSLPEDFTYYPVKRYAEINSLPRLEADRIFRQEAMDFIRNNPGKVVWLWYKRLGHFWRLYPLVATPANKIVALVSSGTVIIGGWIGIILSWRRWPDSRLLLGLVLTYTLVYVISLTNIRYRVPLDGVMMVFAALALWRMSVYYFCKKGSADEKNPASYHQP